MRRLRMDNQDKILFAMIIVMVLIVLSFGAKIEELNYEIEELEWKIDNPGCERIPMCMNGVCQLHDENKRCNTTPNLKPKEESDVS
jgi:hypothetical protein